MTTATPRPKPKTRIESHGGDSGRMAPSRIFWTFCVSLLLLLVDVLPQHIASAFVPTIRTSHFAVNSWNYCPKKDQACHQVRRIFPSPPSLIESEQTRHYHFPSSSVLLWTVATTSSSDSKTSVIATSATAQQVVPFIIEQLPNKTPERVFAEISQMCIEVFFNDDTYNQVEQDKYDAAAASSSWLPTSLLPRQRPLRQRSRPSSQWTPPWKEVQLSYLRTLQRGDLSRRRQLYANTNMMFVARRVVPANLNAETQKQPLLLDLSHVVHLQTALEEAEEAAKKGTTTNRAKSYFASPRFVNGGIGDDEDDDDTPNFVRGPVLGFVEVTQRPYALPEKDFNSNNNNNNSNGDEYEDYHQEYDETTTTSRFHVPLRPVLTNLSVLSSARQSGVGSRLLAAAEHAVRRQWNRGEIILQVEQENVRALRFYNKRGYRVVAQDPASRRYDTQGLWLRQVRCRRQVLRKTLPPMSLGLSSSSSSSSTENGANSRRSNWWSRGGSTATEESSNPVLDAFRKVFSS